jgi:hypothetical protein
MMTEEKQLTGSFEYDPDEKRKLKEITQPNTEEK